MMARTGSHWGGGTLWGTACCQSLIVLLCFTTVIRGQIGWDGPPSTGATGPTGHGDTGYGYPAGPSTGWGTGQTGASATGATGGWGTGGTGGTGSWDTGTGYPSPPSGSTGYWTGRPSPPSPRTTQAPVFTDCGGSFNGPVGNLTSPGFPGPYPSNAYCIYHVNRNTNFTTYLSFVYFGLEGHSSCHWDYLEVYRGEVNFDDEGDVALSQPIARFCGHNATNLNISGGEFTLIFNSDRSISGDGFLLHYGDRYLNITTPTPGNGTSIPGCGGYFDGETGIISSPYYPQAYPNNLDCVYIIDRNTTAATMFEFLDFDIESHFQCLNDYVKVYIGAHPAGRLMRTFCGAPTANFTTSATLITVVFRTNSYVRGNGFRIRYTDAVGNDSQPIDCGGHFNGTTGEITSPGYPDDYPHNVYCVYTIERRNSSQNMLLTFPEFSLEYSYYSCLFDYLMIISGSVNNGNLMASYCGNDVDNITVNANFVTLVFSTDGSVNHGGFRIRYQDAPIEFCGGLFTNDSGQITSPNYPFPYPNHAYCVYTIHRSFVGNISLQFTYFDLESHYDCLYDYLEIYNGTMENGTLYRTVCGSHYYNMVINNTDTITLVFGSDHSVARDGWVLLYESAQSSNISTNVSGCGAVYSAPSGEILSPRYPNNYPHHSNCVYVIHRNSSRATLLSFHYFDLEHSTGCVYDYLKIYRGGPNNNTLVRTYCGSRADDVQIQGNLITLKFVSDRSISGGGFRITYEDGDQIPGQCGGNFTTNSTGILRSPGWPDLYHHRAYCVYYVHRTGQDNLPTRIQFLEFSLEYHSRCQWDYVQVYERNLENRNLLQTYCGSYAPDIYIFSQDFIVLFASDSSVAGEGFMIQYSAYSGTIPTVLPTTVTHRTTTYHPFTWVPTPNPNTTIMDCGRSAFYSDAGTISSPNYPNNYGNSMNCVYTIRRAGNTATLLQTNRFHLESSETCGFDSLKVYSGSIQGGNVVGTYCGTDGFRVVVPSSYITLVFTSDGSLTYPGWQIRFSGTFVTSTSTPWSSTRYPTSCGGHFYGIIGDIYSPSYPSEYGNNLDCVYVIQRASTVRMALRLVEFKLEEGDHCQYDYVQVIEGDLHTGHTIEKLCGIREDTLVTDNYVTLRFVTDNTITMKGFHIHYGDADSDCNVGESMCRDNSRCFTQWQHCNGIADCADGSDEYSCPAASTGNQNLLVIPLTVVGMILLIAIIIVAVIVGVYYHRRKRTNGRAEPSASFAASPATATLGVPSYEVPMPAPMPAAVPPLANPAGGYDNPLYAVAAQNTPNGNVETKEPDPPTYESLPSPVDTNMKAYLIEPKEHGVTDT